jgi:small-conductance mechanosensitive channel
MSQPLASINVSQSFQNLLNTVVNAVPRILVFLVILIVGWIIAKVLARVVDVILHKVKFDHFVERGAVGAALQRSNTDATALISKIVYYAIVLIALQMAFGVFGTNPISTMLNAIVAWLPRAIVAIIIIVIASAIAKVVKDLVAGAIGGLSYGVFLANAASIIIIVLGAIAALNQVGIAGAITTPILNTVLITCGAVVAIGVGGGLVKPMQARWERMLAAAERETNTRFAAYQQGRSDAMNAPARPRPEEAAPTQSYGAPRGGAPRGGDPRGGGAPEGGAPQGGIAQDPGD